jgi:GT2 family glycosyltransferase
MKNPSVLISVLNYNNFNSTKKCVNSLIQYIRDGEEIFIIDNNSPDNSFIKLKDTFKTIKVVKSKVNGGYASGHKIAVDYAINNNFELIWILNNDLTVREKTLIELSKAYIKNGLALYGSITLKSEKPDIINFGGGKIDDISKPFNYNSYENISLENYNNKTGFRAVQSIEGSSFVIPAKVIKKHGFMREDFFMYVEETDYCYRLNKLGIKSYVVPESIVVHKGAESLKEKKYLEKYYRRRNFLFFENNHYGISIFKNIAIKSGLINSIKFFISFFINFKTKDDLYYLNLANFHALINKKGKLK